MGGDVTLPALRVQTDLARGRCLPSHTFGDRVNKNLDDIGKRAGVQQKRR